MNVNARLINSYHSMICIEKPFADITAYEICSLGMTNEALRCCKINNPTIDKDNLNMPYDLITPWVLYTLQI